MNDSAQSRRGTYVAITGPIAAGATTLAQLLASRLGWRTFADELVQTSNAFFTDAYSNFRRWGFHSQVHFALASARRHDLLRIDLARAPAAVYVEDRTPYEHVDAYLKAYTRLDLISERESKLLEALAVQLQNAYIIPDIMIFRRVRIEVMIERVRMRGRPGESIADLDILRGVHSAMYDMMESWDRSPKLILNESVDLFSASQVDHTLAQVTDVMTSNGRKYPTSF